MEPEPNLLEKIDVLNKDQELCSKLTKILPEILQGSITNTKDFLIGTDSNCIYVKSSSGNEAVVKIPRYLHEPQSLEDKKPMHQSSKQAWILKVLKNLNILCPDLLYVDPDDKFLVEKFILEKNYLEAEPEITKQDQSLILSQLGQNLSLMHSLKSSKYGYLTLEKDNEGNYETWISFFDRFEEVLLPEFKKQDSLQESKIQIIKNIKQDQAEYLANFSDPRILHADLCTRNFLVKKHNNSYQLSGLIDFANIIAGDPLYDIGNILCEFGGEWEVINELEKGYFTQGNFNNEQKKVVIFYAIWYCLWNIGFPENQFCLSFNLQTLDKLISLYH